MMLCLVAQFAQDSNVFWRVVFRVNITMVSLYSVCATAPRALIRQIHPVRTQSSSTISNLFVFPPVIPRSGHPLRNSLFVLLAKHSLFAASWLAIWVEALRFLQTEFSYPLSESGVRNAKLGSQYFALRILNEISLAV
jgi:hypothetical protein